jgi:hypothetical protein
MNLQLMDLKREECRTPIAPSLLENIIASALAWQHFSYRNGKGERQRPPVHFAQPFAQQRGARARFGAVE